MKNNDMNESKNSSCTATGVENNCDKFLHVPPIPTAPLLHILLNYEKLKYFKCKRFGNKSSVEPYLQCKLRYHKILFLKSKISRKYVSRFIIVFLSCQKYFRLYQRFSTNLTNPWIIVIRSHSRGLI